MKQNHRTRMKSIVSTPGVELEIADLIQVQNMQQFDVKLASSSTKIS